MPARHARLGDDQRGDRLKVDIAMLSSLARRERRAFYASMLLGLALPTAVRNNCRKARSADDCGARAASASSGSSAVVFASCRVQSSAASLRMPASQPVNPR
jgi:hypothetical protein